MVAEPVPFNPSIGVHVSAADPLTKAGIVSQLRSAQGFIVSSGDTPHVDGVALVVADDVTDAVTTEIRSLRARGVSRVVLLVTWVNDKGLLAVAEAGVSGVIRRSEATAHNLGVAIRAAAAGEGTLPPDLLGRLLRQVGELQRQGRPDPGFDRPRAAARRRPGVRTRAGRQRGSVHLRDRGG